VSSEDDIRNCIREHLSGWDGADEALRSITFMSLNEYRESVGERRFQFETDLLYPKVQQ
jgi:hypothetical protein